MHLNSAESLIAPVSCVLNKLVNNHPGLSSFLKPSKPRDGSQRQPDGWEKFNVPADTLQVISGTEIIWKWDRKGQTTKCAQLALCSTSSQGGVDLLRIVDETVKIHAPAIETIEQVQRVTFNSHPVQDYHSPCRKKTPDFFWRNCRQYVEQRHTY